MDYKLLKVDKDDLCQCNNNIFDDWDINIDNQMFIQNLYKKDKIKEILNSPQVEIKDSNINHYHFPNEIVETKNTCDVCKKIFLFLQDLRFYDQYEEDLKAGKRKKATKERTVKSHQYDTDDIKDLFRNKYYEMENIDFKKVEKESRKVMHDLIKRNIIFATNYIPRELVSNYLMPLKYSDIEKEYIIKYIEDNIPYVIKREIMNRHPYFSLSNLNKESLNKQREILEKIFKQQNYENFNKKSLIVSYKYNNLNSLDNSLLGGNIFFKEPFIDPVIFALFSNKLPFIDDLITKVDTLEVLMDMMRENKIKDQNKFIMFLKAFDKSSFFRKYQYTNNEDKLKDELSRIIFHNMIKMQALKIRQGNWSCNLTNEIYKMIDKISDSCKTEEERILDAIFKCIPFKPTLVTKATDISIAIPNSVSYVEYNIESNRHESIKDSLKLDNNLIQNLYYDINNGRLSITRRKLGYEQNYYANINEINNIGPLLNTPYYNTLFKKYDNNNIVLFSNGVFIISIPRIKKLTITSNYSSGYKELIMDDLIEYSDVLNIGGESFKLNSAVCCKTMESEGIFNFCIGKEYIGRYAYTRLSDFEDNWVKYDPYSMVDIESRNKWKNSVITQYIEDERNNEFDDVDPVIGGETRIFSKTMDMKNNIYSIRDFVAKDSQEVKNNIMRYGTLLIYSSRQFNNEICSLPC